MSNTQSSIGPHWLLTLGTIINKRRNKTKTKAIKNIEMP